MGFFQQPQNEYNFKLWVEFISGVRTITYILLWDAHTEECVKTSRLGYHIRFWTQSHDTLPHCILSVSLTQSFGNSRICPHLVGIKLFIYLCFFACWPGPIYLRGGGVVPIWIYRAVLGFRHGKCRVGSIPHVLCGHICSRNAFPEDQKYPKTIP